jgi:tetratricopeptide (TPR) repeat protein
LRGLPVALAKNRLSQGDNAGAETVIHETLAWAREAHGDPSPQVASVLGHLAYNYHALGSDDQVAAQREALSIYRQVYGGDHRSVLSPMIGLAHTLRWRGDAERSDLEAAEAILQEASDLVPGLYGDEVPWTIQEKITRAFGLLHLAQGRTDEAESMLRKAVEIARENAPLESLQIRYAESAYGACLTALGRYEEAESLLVGTYEDFRLWDAQSSDLQPSMGSRRTAARLIDLYRGLGDSERVRKYEEELRALEPPPKQSKRSF